MLSPKVFKWVVGMLLLTCLGWVVFSIIAISNIPEPTRVVSVTPLGDGIAVYEMLYDSGGATVPFVYRYFVLKQQETSEAVLGEVRSAEPFLVTTTSGAVRAVVKESVSLEVKSTVYEFKGVVEYQINGEIKTIRFTLNGH